VRGRWGLVLAAVVGTLAVSLGTASAASADTIWATCSWGGQSRTCDSTAWYPSALTVVWHADPAPDSTPGCALEIAYHYNTDQQTPVSCSATWPTGTGTTTITQPYTLQVEISDPSASATPIRSPDSNGWYNHAVTAAVTASSFSGIASCAPSTYSGPDSRNATVSVSCTDNAGKSVTATSSAFKYEASSPTITVGLSRSGDSNGWYNHPVSAAVSGVSFSGIASCSGKTYSGPDATNATVSGSCIDNAGKSVSGTSTAFPYEASTPTVSVGLSRVADSNGWYNHPVTAAVNGSSFSGIASCTPATYSGPDATNATVGGTCTDNAGKKAKGASGAFRYDASPPVQNFTADAADRIVLLHWSRTDRAPLASLEVMRKPGRHGRAASVVYRARGTAFRDRSVRNGVRYRYTLVAADQAGNVARESVVVTPGPRLLEPSGGALVSTPPILRWTAVRRATYYNVQLYRGGRKIFSAWPSQTSLQLQSTWSFEGRRHRLRPGRYRWYVWPGFGRRAAARYGPMIGSSTFVAAPQFG
jgi:hypothetical protein